MLGQQLAAELQTWRRVWLAMRPPETQNMHNKAALYEVMGPVDWLAEQTLLNKRKINEYMNGRQKFVGVTQADKVLTAIGRQDLLHNTIHVIPNPHWSIDWWIAYMEERGCI